MSATELKRVEALLASGDHSSAKDALENLVAADGENTEALHLLGTVYMQQGDHATAAKTIRKVLSLDAFHAPAAYNLGVCLLEAGDLEGSLAQFRKATEIDPSHSGALYNIGYLMRRWGRLSESEAAFAKLVSVNPAWTSAVEAYCECLFAQRKYAQAKEQCDQHARTQSPHARILKIRGDAHRSLGMLDEALKDYLASIKVNPNDPGTLQNLAGLYRMMGRPDDAIPFLERVMVLSAQPTTVTPTFDLALNELILSCRAQAQWKRLAVYEDQAHRRLLDGNSFMSPGVAAMITDDQALIGRSLANTRYSEVPARSSGQSIPHGAAGRIRVGFILDEFGDNSTATQYALLLELLDKSQFECFAYRAGPFVASDNRRRIKAQSEFRNVEKLSDEEIASTILGDKLDVLVNGMSFGANSRLGVLAYKPAPIIVNFLSFPGPTGMQGVDFVISDGIVSPQSDGLNIVRLAQSHRALPRHRLSLDKPSTRSAFGLKDDSLVFCCHAPLSLIGQTGFLTYMDILARVPNSVLWLTEDQFAVRARLREAATSKSVNADRLVFSSPAMQRPLEREPSEDTVLRLKHADLFLDTWSLSAEYEAFNALSVGLPVLTRAGNSMASRMTAGLLESMGLGELVVSTEEAFVSTAAKLALDPARLASLRNKLSNSTDSPAFDGEGLARHFSDAIRQIARRQGA